MNDAMISKKDKKKEAWLCFMAEMEGRSFGKEETLNAWLWFFAGWKKANIKYKKEVSCPEITK